MKLFLLALSLLISTTLHAAPDEWCRVVIENQGAKTQFNFVIKPAEGVQTLLAFPIWVNVQGPLGSGSRVDAEIFATSSAEDETAHSIERLELLYDVRRSHYTWQASRPYPVRIEGHTGGYFFPQYFVTVTATDGDGKVTVLSERAPVDLKSRIK